MTALVETERRQKAAAVAASLKGVTHRYGKTVALDNVTLEIPAGRMTGLIGPDGVGKSTLLGLIAGVRKIQTGEVRALDGDLKDAAFRQGAYARIAYMPQGLGRNLYPTLSVFENLDFIGRLFGQGEAERKARIDDLTRSTGLDPFLARPAGKLSGGMKQKASLCCSLIHDPDLLILDEPTTGVDPLSRRQFWELIDRIRARRPQMSVVVATAYMIAAAVVVLIVGIGVWQWPNMVELYRSLRAPAVDTAHEAPPPAATRPKIADRIEPGSPQAPAAPGPATQAAVPAAQKVVLYEEDPADPNGKRFVGSAIWRTETVTPGPGQPPELAIRADVEVPERKLAMTWSLRRNTDKGLPATHTVEIMFKLPADFPSGGISNVPGILMKQAEQTRGTPLAGLAVKVTPGFYLIGLSNAETDKDRNLQLLKERSWFDIPVVYNNNRRAILALEKGTPGERVFADAFKAWKQ